MKYISHQLDFSRPVTGHAWSISLQQDKMPWRRGQAVDSLNHQKCQGMKKVFIHAGTDNGRDKLGRRWLQLIGSSPRSEMSRRTRTPDPCLTPLGQGFFNYFLLTTPFCLRNVLRNPRCVGVLFVAHYYNQLRKSNFVLASSLRIQYSTVRRQWQVKHNVASHIESTVKKQRAMDACFLLLVHLQALVHAEVPSTFQ